MTQMQPGGVWISISDAELEARIARAVTKQLRPHLGDQWMNAAEAAHHLRMSHSHFLRRIRRGDGPEGYGEKRLRRWRRSTLDHWLENRPGSAMRTELANPSKKALSQTPQIMRRD